MSKGSLLPCFWKNKQKALWAERVFNSGPSDKLYQPALGVFPQRQLFHQGFQPGPVGGVFPAGLQAVADEGVRNVA